MATCGRMETDYNLQKKIGQAVFKFYYYSNHFSACFRLEYSLNISFAIGLWGAINSWAEHRPFWYEYSAILIIAEKVFIWGLNYKGRWMILQKKLQVSQNLAKFHRSRSLGFFYISD